MPSLSSSAARSARAARKASAALSRASRRALMAAAVTLGATLLLGSHANATPAVGDRAPDFVAIDTQGTRHQLSDFAGRFVVLEWADTASPEVLTHYDSGALPATQKSATAQGAVWLSMVPTDTVAGARPQPGALERWMAEHAAAPTALLVDENGVIGQAYGAKMRPHLFVISPDGVLMSAASLDDPRAALQQVDDVLRTAMGTMPGAPATGTVASG
ncbi:redoxin domain-containing protein [Variovorax ginsengisoli]|uniref:Peroxiredoxin n=1 Tax=Variovorax ginsengisoli TaxID=363844 RepID=A0ABT9S9Y3_9BURK|nr:redoxin domain-containing protein [Variovorax ginsengisoli]MDP9901170.1 peroxiredoxin [Variovorax ginsengisoli]